MSFLMKSIMLLSLYFCCLKHVHAEESQRERAVLRFGGSIGGGLVDLVGKNADAPPFEEVTKPGFTAGVFTTIHISRLLSLDIDPLRLKLQPELSYVTRGSKLERDGEYRGASTNLTYLQAGILLRAEYATPGRVMPYLVLGPELGYLLSAKFENGLGDTIDISDNLKSTDLGLIFGLGAMYSLPPWGALGLELRADLGLVSIDGQGDGEIRNAALTLLLAYLY
jgi:Outer membrane protein beta-barrel domain